MNLKCVPALLLIVLSPLIHAQPLLDHHNPKGQNVRLAWSLDADGGVDGDEWKGFEAAYASEIYPLDQLIVSFAHHNYDDNTSNSLLFSIEEFYPLSETLVPYGVAGIGYMWTDFAAGSAGQDDGMLLKLGTGLLVKLCEAFHLYGEISFNVSDRDIWLDGDNGAAAQNWQGLLGFRFNY
ncbi:MAG: hypothetical protein WD708_10940 [Kiritimatiellia bacterium]